MRSMYTVGFVLFYQVKDMVITPLLSLLSLSKGNKMKSGLIISFLLQFSITDNVISRTEGTARLHSVLEWLTEK